MRREAQGVRREALGVRTSLRSHNALSLARAPGQMPLAHNIALITKGASSQGPLTTTSPSSQKLVASCLKPPAPNIALITQALAHASAGSHVSSEAPVKIHSNHAQRLASGPRTRAQRRPANASNPRLL